MCETNLVDAANYERWMSEAIQLAKRGAGHVAPNPLVGALVLCGGQVIGRGYHERYGEAHAEINAIEDALRQRRDLEGCTLVVTLEPCSHFGKTPPCCERIAKEGITKVIVGMMDPNHLVAGRGIAYLKDWGIDVITGVLEDELQIVNEAFVHHITTKRPFVTMKTAMTLDGKIATVSGDSKWVSCEAARYWVHELRQASSGIMVGIGTILADDALLTTRLSHIREENISHPIPIIVDSKGRIPLDAKVLNTGIDRPVIIATTAAMPDEKLEQLKAMGCSVYSLTGADARVDLGGLMAILGEIGVNSVLLEGGGTLNAAALEAGVVQKVISIVAPKLVGGRYGKTPVSGTGVEYMSEALILNQLSCRMLGEDVLIEGYLEEVGMCKEEVK
ncbi:MAG: bifunctional diaminohydroxyphosphoribosylaminopyrimidine deaminase/5-amino-6-(5-phosphoribosylamino)uracil reductase RibD [Clostridia bacterium]|nr:bifunctional diaminohydroxyphosphoribosylaminopyrimidine deaminase/5-amino-6-(5-phosphoribosylamino)uracil reductase RibD [Clostridia bacterium]